jgi:hypothetical protein
MFSLQDGIKYVGLAIIIFFLIKAFISDKMDNKQIVVLVIAIMAIVIFLVCHRSDCPKERFKNQRERKLAGREYYEITDPPIVDSIYPGPENTEERSAPLLPPPPPIKNRNKDIQDFMDIMGIDKQLYEKLIKRENKAKEKIRQNYRDEMVYTTTNPFNTVPLGTQLYGYTYLPPENWFRAYERPPVCVSDSRCPVCPIADGGSTSGLMEFDTSNNIMGPDGIDLRYVKRVLNKGRTTF